MKTIKVSYEVLKFNPDRWAKDETETKFIAGTKEFRDDKEAQKFLERLAKIKLQLACRCAGIIFRKGGDIFEPDHGYQCTPGGRKLKHKARGVSDKNKYKLKVEIQTV